MQAEPKEAEAFSEEKMLFCHSNIKNNPTTANIKQTIAPLLHKMDWRS